MVKEKRRQLLFRSVSVFSYEKWLILKAVTF